MVVDHACARRNARSARSGVPKISPRRKGEATARLVELLDSPSQRTALEASKHVLGIEGIAPPRDGSSVHIHGGEGSGYVIYLGRAGDEPAHAEVGMGGGVVYGRSQEPSVIDVTPNKAGER